MRLAGQIVQQMDFLSALTFSSLCHLKEKAPFEAKAAKRKAEYEKQMKAYNKKLVRFFSF